MYYKLSLANIKRIVCPKWKCCYLLIFLFCSWEGRNECRFRRTRGCVEDVLSKLWMGSKPTQDLTDFHCYQGYVCERPIIMDNNNSYGCAIVLSSQSLGLVFWQNTDSMTDSNYMIMIMFLWMFKVVNAQREKTHTNICWHTSKNIKHKTIQLYTSIHAHLMWMVMYSPTSRLPLGICLYQ